MGLISSMEHHREWLKHYWVCPPSKKFNYSELTFHEIQGSSKNLWGKFVPQDPPFHLTAEEAKWGMGFLKEAKEGLEPVFWQWGRGSRLSWFWHFTSAEIKDLAGAEPLGSFAVWQICSGVKVTDYSLKCSQVFAAESKSGCVKRSSWWDTEKNTYTIRPGWQKTWFLSWLERQAFKAR